VNDRTDIPPFYEFLRYFTTNIRAEYRVLLVKACCPVNFASVTVYEDDRVTTEISVERLIFSHDWVPHFPPNNSRILGNCL